ncbi:MAG: MFS transporter [Candidatus Paceibacterota bacterium]|jgi:MFS family permease
MDTEKLPSKNTAVIIYLLGFLYALHVALPTYIASSFLENILGASFIGIVYTTGAITTLIAFLLTNKILRRFGNYKTIISLAIIEIIALIILSSSQQSWLIFIAFVVSFTAISLTHFAVDIFLESFTGSNKTGKVRGNYLTMANVAWVLAPMISSFILGDSNDYWKVYAVSAIIIIPVFILIRKNLKGFVDPEYTDVPIIPTIEHIWHNKNLRSILSANFLLQIFYSWMVIYMPIYLHQIIGFNWEQIGIIFAVMLLPFILTEAPLGRLADTKYGEKEILSIGFVVVAISTIIISFITTNNFYLWMAILFCTRIGASMIEIMTDTYFFKKVNESRVNIVSIFRTMLPWSYVIGPFVASAFLMFGVPLQYIFLILGIIMLGGLQYSLAIEDTR